MTIGHYYPHFDRTKYIQCGFLLDPTARYSTCREIYCPSGLIWDQSKVQCDFPVNIGTSNISLSCSFSCKWDAKNWWLLVILWKNLLIILFYGCYYVFNSCSSRNLYIFCSTGTKVCRTKASLYYLLLFIRCVQLYPWRLPRRLQCYERRKSV